jgi:hypothetical protein
MITENQMNLKRILCTFSGDDYSIISRCDDKIQNRFIAIGCFVSLIFIFCFISSYYSFTLLFKNYYFGVSIGVFFALTVTNIYLLILYTLSKKTFPCIEDNKATFFSVSIRILFITLIAVIVSKPLEVIKYENELSKEISFFKTEQKLKYLKIIDSIYIEETEQLKSIIERQQKNTNFSLNDISNYIKIIELKDKNRLEKKTQMENLINDSNYYIKSISILNSKYPSCWIITLFIILIFLFPAYLKNFLGEQSFYYETKRTIENRLVKEEYASFKSRYNRLFQEHLNKNIQFSEPFIDAPFNTKRKRDGRVFLKEDDLISDLYNA